MKEGVNLKKYFCDISTVSEEDFIVWYHQMQPSRQEKCKKLKQKMAQKQCIAADHLIKSALADHFDRPINEVSYSISPSGKPYVEDNSVYFSISHSHNIVLCVLSEFPVGVDIERIRPISKTSWKRICTENELKYLSSSENEEQLRRFFTLWTRKEAIFKIHGNLPRQDKETETLTFPENWTAKTWEEKGYIVSVVQWKKC